MARPRSADPWRDTERPDLARKYGVAVVPTVLAVGSDGTVLERLAP
jgi:hypothetical protein